MVDRATRAELTALTRQIAEQRGYAAKLRFALGNGDPSLAALALRHMRTGQPWQNLSMPSGARGTAVWRPVTDGRFEVALSLAWKTASSIAYLAGLPPQGPSMQVIGGVTIEVAANGMLSLAGAGTSLNTTIRI